MYVETYRVSTQIESARPFLTLWWGFSRGNIENKGRGWVGGWVGVRGLERELDSVDVNDGSKDHQMVGGSY